MFKLNNADQPLFPADTLGWDSVYAIPFDKLNSAISGQAPADFDDFQETDEQGDVFILRNSTYGDWRIDTGGSGQIVCMEIALDAFEFERQGSSPVSYSVTNAVATVMLKLAALPQPSSLQASADPDVEVVELRVAPTNTDPIQSVSVAYDPDGAETPDVVSQFQINDLLTKVLNRDADDFNLVFATVNLSKKTSEAGGEGWDWLLPTHTSYAVRDLNATSGVFAVLAMTENRPASPIHDVSVAAIPEGQVSGFLVSERLFLQKLVLPNVGLLFQHKNGSMATVDDFEITSDFKITNKNAVYIKDLELEDPGKGGDGKKVLADIGPRQFTVFPSGDELVMRIDQFHYSYAAGIEVYSDFENRSTVSLVDGGFAVEERSSSCPRADIEKSDWLTWTEILVPIGVGIVGAVLGAGVGKVVSGTGQVVAQGANAGVFTGVQGTVVGVTQAGAAQAATGQVAATLALEVAGNTAPISLIGIVPGFTYRLIAGIAGAVLGAGLGGMVGILETIAKEPASARPVLDKFLAPALAAVSWPNVDGFVLTSARLNKSFQLGIDPVLASEASEEAA